MTAPSQDLQSLDDIEGTTWGPAPEDAASVLDGESSKGDDSEQRGAELAAENTPGASTPDSAPLQNRIEGMLFGNQ